MAFPTRETSQFLFLSLFSSEKAAALDGCFFICILVDRFSILSAIYLTDAKVVLQ